MITREELQAEWVDSWRDRGILNLCPRAGKIKVSIDICRKYNIKDILICYPRKDIQASWEADFKKWGFNDSGVEYSTFASLDKKLKRNYGLVILDEIHEASDAQLTKINARIQTSSSLGLSGTITKKTEDNIYGMTGMEICAKYSIEEGVRDNILPDYQIFIHQIPLDSLVLDEKGRSEKKRFSNIQFLMNTKKMPRQFASLKLIQIIQGSLSKLNKTKELIKQYEADRLLVFCGTTNIADQLGINCYHSKSKEGKILEDFLSGILDHLCCIKLLQAGVTVKPIRRGIINYMSGNPEDSAQKIARFLTLEYNNPDKRAEIHIISSTEKFELDRLKTGLMFFEQNKIKYI